MRAPVPARTIGLRPVSLVAVLAALLASLTTITVADAAVKTRTILLLPFATVDVGRDEQWIGEGVTHSLALGLAQVPSVIQIDRARLKQVNQQPEAWDEQSAGAAARALHAHAAIYPPVRPTLTVLLLPPRSLH